MRLWPLILISLGVELIASNIHRGDEKEEILKYDKGAIFLVFVLACFAAVMGVIEYSMNYSLTYSKWKILLTF